MRILYNALSTRTGGGFSYARDQVMSLLAIDGVDIEVVTAPWNHELWQSAGVDPEVLTLVDVSSVALRVAWEQVVLPWRARSHDLMLSPGNMGPLWCPVPQVVVLQNPNYVGAGRRAAKHRGLGYQAKTGLSFASMRRSAAVISVSRMLTEEIRSEPRLRGVRVETVRTGGAVPVEGEADGPAIEALVGAEPYVLSVANDYPHKRLDDIGALVARLAQESDPPVERVVLAGDVPEGRREEIRARAGRSADRLLFLGSVGDPEVIAGLYRHAFAALSTSEMESWGLTLPEAGARGCPVVATDLPAHREVAGDRALYVVPGDVEAIVEKLREVAAGSRPEPWLLDRTWSDHGAELAEVLRDVVEQGGRS